MVDERSVSNQNTLINSLNLKNIISKFIYFIKVFIHKLYLLGFTTIEISQLFFKFINKYFVFYLKQCITFIHLKLNISFVLLKKCSLKTIFNVKKFVLKTESVIKNFKAEYKTKKFQNYKDKTCFVLQYLKSGLRKHKAIVNSVMNYIYPALGLAVLIVSVGVVNGFEYGLSVDCFGKHIGYIENEYVFLDASKQMNSRIHYVKDQELINDTPRFTLVRLTDNDKLTNKESVVDELLKASNKMICQATGLYINDNFVGAVKNKNEIKNILESHLKPWQDKYEDAQISFVDNVSLQSGYYLTDSLCDINDINEILSSPKEETINYTVRKGDTPITIAADNNVSYDQLRELNPGIEEDLKPGQQVIVSSAKPLLSVKIVKTAQEEEEIAYKTEIKQDANIVNTYRKIVQKGKNGVIKKTYKTTFIDGVECSSEIMSENMISSPTNEVILVGTKFVKCQFDKGRNNKEYFTLLDPVPNGRISCGWYGYKGHTGIDLSAPSGSPIRASGAGQVIFVGMRNGYGNCIIIDHGNGMQTKYAHNSRNLVKVGDNIDAGDKIAEVGRTGNATGYHCHFEVILNGVPRDPSYYIRR